MEMLNINEHNGHTVCAQRKCNLHIYNHIPAAKLEIDSTCPTETRNIPVSDRKEGIKLNCIV